MRRMRADTEVAGRRAFELEPRRCAKRRRHRIAFVAPGRERAFGRERPRDVRDRGAALLRGAQRGKECDAVAVDA